MIAYHPAADIFPPMSEAEYNALKADIATNGLIEPILVDTKTKTIIDGRHRYRACQELGLALKLEKWEGDDPVAFVLSMNLHRRHLNESQRGLVASHIASFRNGDNQHAQICAPSQTEAATMLNVSRRTVQTGRKVLDHGSPDLIHAVESGEVAVSTAAVLTELPKEEQAEVVARGERDILAKAREIRDTRNRANRQVRIENIAASIVEPTALEDIAQRFPVIYADPPWRYEHCENPNDAIEAHYPTMELDAICDLPIQDLCTKHAILFLWATSPKLKEAMRVIDSWGFTYRTAAVWNKGSIGLDILCSACYNTSGGEQYAAQRQGSISKVRTGILLPEESQGRTPDSPQELRSVPQVFLGGEEVYSILQPNVPAPAQKPSNEGQEAVLPERRRTASELQGIPDAQGLSVRVQFRESERQQAGLDSGASVGNGTNAGKTTHTHRGSASQESQSCRQSPGKPRTEVLENSHDLSLGSSACDMPQMQPCSRCGARGEFIVPRHICKIGPGYYFRQQHELLLVATRGEIPVPLPENRPASVFNSPRTDHSHKPEAFHEFIEAMYPTLPKVELFARQAREGWVVWGNQV